MGHGATERDPTLPDFTNPPVIETVLSLQFAPLEQFGIPHFGLYWQKIRSEYPRYELHPPLIGVTEKFDPSLLHQKIGLRIDLGFALGPAVRCWFIDESGNRLLQVQKDRFIYNWRKVKGDEIYPRYESIKDKFKEEWLRFCAFLREENLGAPEVNQCEVTYVNHIDYNSGWEGYGELSKVIACWKGSYSGTFLPPPEKVNLNVSHLLPGKEGRLHISLEPVLRSRDAVEVLQLNLTARGAPSSSSVEDIFRWLDLGRSWVVRGFTDFTTENMHKKLWGRES
jgi:uncharacterized protein (TIGR04255 family)